MDAVLVLGLRLLRHALNSPLPGRGPGRLVGRGVDRLARRYRRWLLRRAPRVRDAVFPIALPHGVSFRLKANVFDITGSYLVAVRVWGGVENLAFITRCLRPGDTALDVGANVGFFTMLFARCVGDGGHCYAFEGYPANCTRLLDNLSLNGVTNAELVAALVSNTDGLTTLSYAEDNSGSPSIVSVYYPGDPRVDRLKSVTVPAVTLDTWSAHMGLARPVRLLKMDIQGAEPLALTGAASVLLPGPLPADLHPARAHHAGRRWKALRAAECVRVRAPRRCPRRRAGPADADPSGTDRAKRDYVFATRADAESFNTE